MEINAGLQYQYPFKIGYFLGHTCTKIKEEALVRLKKAFPLSDEAWAKHVANIENIKKNVQLELTQKREHYIRDNKIAHETIAMIEQSLIDAGVEPSSVDIKTTDNDDVDAFVSFKSININLNNFNALSSDTEKKAVIAHEIGHLIDAHSYVSEYVHWNIFYFFSTEKREYIENQFNDIITNTYDKACLELPDDICKFLMIYSRANKLLEMFKISNNKYIKALNSGDFCGDMLNLMSDLFSPLDNLQENVDMIYRILKYEFFVFHSTKEQKEALNYFNTTISEFVADLYLASSNSDILEQILELRIKRFNPLLEDSLINQGAYTPRFIPGYPTNNEKFLSLCKNLLSKLTYIKFLSRFYDELAFTNTIEYAGTERTSRTFLTSEFISFCAKKVADFLNFAKNKSDKH